MQKVLDRIKDEKLKEEIIKDIEEEKKMNKEEKMIMLEKTIEQMADMMYKQNAEIEKMKETTEEYKKEIKKMNKKIDK